MIRETKERRNERSMNPPRADLRQAQGDRAQRVTDVAAGTIALLPNQRKAWISFFPRRFNPHMVGIFGYRQSTRCPRKKIQVVNVVPRPGHHRMKPGMNQ